MGWELGIHRRRKNSNRMAGAAGAYINEEIL
jgi:hypothetical protein